MGYSKDYYYGGYGNYPSPGFGPPVSPIAPYKPLIFAAGGVYLIWAIIFIVLFLAGVGGMIALIVYATRHMPAPHQSA